MQNLVTMNELVMFPKVKAALEKLKLNTENQCNKVYLIKFAVSF